MFSIKRCPDNPVLSPIVENPWENAAVFNACPVKNGKNIDVVYRAMSSAKSVHGNTMNLSVIGHASSKDGVDFGERNELIIPEEEWEKFGCEDPRITKIGDKYFIFYTALGHYPFDADGIRVAVAITKDLKKIDEKHLVTPFNAKAMSLFPEKVNGKLTAVLTANTDSPPSKISIIQFEKESDIWSQEYWRRWYSEIDQHTISLTRSDQDHVEIGAPPVKTKDGWLFVYCYIQNYFSGDKVFGIEAFVTDLKNPTKIIKRTKKPFLVPEANYEIYGMVPNIIFPSGSIVLGKKLRIYYGAADTTVACADVDLELLLASMDKKKIDKVVKRYPKNPILVPNPDLPWQAKAVFNPGAVEINGKIHLFFRAMSLDNTSVSGYAMTKDGYKLKEISDQPSYVPRMDFEVKKVPGGNSGCEDIRLMNIGDKVYVFYTAYNGLDSPKVAISSMKVSDFENQKWEKWSEPIIVSPEKEWDKDSCVIPEKINGKYFIIHRLGRSICADYIDSLDFNKERVGEYVVLMKPRPGMWDSHHIGLSTPPIKTKAGWLLFYHGVDNNGVYRLGLALLDKKNPEILLGRTSTFIMEPETPYELQGQVNNVVFPCGTVLRDGKVFIYYGGADSVVGVATAELDDLLKMFA